MEKVILNNTPNNDDFWRSLGGQFSNAAQIIEEFVDNSLSNCLSNPKLYSKDNNVNIDINFYRQNKYIINDENNKPKYSQYAVEISDNGSGINNLANAFELGGQKSKDSTMNEHGFGLKHALAAADPQNRNWSVITQWMDDDRYATINSPYEINHQPVTFNDGGIVYRPGFNHGTIIRFNISAEMMKTIANGVKGKQESLESLLTLLKEELGYTYGKILDNPQIKIRLAIFDEEQLVESTIVQPLEIPKHHNFEKEINTNKPDFLHPDPNHPGATLNVKFIQIDEHADTTMNKKYYKYNSSTAGIELRVNHRLISRLPFNTIWSITQHPDYNGMNVIIDVMSNNPEELPRTNTNKTGIIPTDEMFKHIKAFLTGHTKKFNQYGHSKDDEQQLFKKAKEYYQSHNQNNDTYATEVSVYDDLELDPRIDFYHQQIDGKVTIYEGKLKQITAENIYQLLMYWDGLVYDQNPIHSGVLVSDNVSDSIKKIIANVNTLEDANGDHYNISYMSWNEFLPNGIEHQSK